MQQALPLLVEAVRKAERPRARAEAARTLGEIGGGSESARQALEAATSDEDESVRDAAKKALELLRA